MKTWIDCTKELFDDVRDFMKNGEYVLYSDFGLEDSLVALDIDDPKMDRGLILIDDKRLILFKEYFSKNFSKHPLALEQPDIYLVCSFMDQVFELECCWLQGWLYSDTLLTCLPLYHVMLIKFPPLKLFCFIVLRIHEIICEIMLKSSVLREEDLNFNMHSFVELLEEIPPLDDMLKDLENLFSSIETENYAHSSTFLQIKSRLSRLLSWGRIFSFFKKHNKFLNSLDQINDQLHLLLIEMDMSIKSEIMIEKNISSDNSKIKDLRELAVYSELSNSYIYGCPRPYFDLASRQECIVKHRDSLEIIFKFCKQLASSYFPLSNEQKLDFPLFPLNQLLNYLSELHAFKDFTPFSRVIISYLILPMSSSTDDQQFLFGQIPYKAYFETSNIHLQQIFIDFIKLICHSWSRQHRLLFKLLPVIKGMKGKFIELNKLYTFLEINYILIGFGLDLYNVEESFQAIW